ncbi:14264_t:CDS:2, partial [Gigaspora rosea]
MDEGDEVLDEILELVDDEDNERLNSLLPEPSNSNEYAQEKRSSRTSSQKRKNQTFKTFSSSTSNVSKNATTTEYW